MQFSCQKSVLLENVNIVLKAVSAKSTVPILEGICVKAEDGKIKLFGNDLKIAIESSFLGDIEDEGTVVLNAKLFFDIISKLKDGDISISSDENFKVIIKSGRAKFELYGMNPEDFPTVEYVEPDIKLNISKTKIKNIIKQTIFSIGSDDKKIALTGALFDIKGDILKVVSIDGYRLSYREVNIGETSVNEKYIIPGKTLGELLKILNDDEADVEMGFTGNRVHVKSDNFILYSNLIDGEFFNYSQIIPGSCELTLFADTKEFIDSIIRASLVIASDIKSPLKLEITKDQIFISSNSKNGRAQDLLQCVTEGDDLTIGFNHRFLLDALKACETDKVKMEFTTPLNPLVIRPCDSGEFIYLILPLRLRNE